MKCESEHLTPKILNYERINQPPTNANRLYLFQGRDCFGWTHLRVYRNAEFWLILLAFLTFNTMRSVATAVFLAFVSVVSYSGQSIAYTLETGGQIDHLNHEVELNQNRIMSMGEQYGKVISEVQEKFSKMKKQLEEALNQLSGDNRKYLTLSSDVASLKQTITQDRATASSAIKNVEEEIKDAVNSQQSAVVSLTEKLSELQRSMEELREGRPEVQAGQNVAGMIEKSPVVMDLAERIKAMEASLMVDPPLADVLKRTSASLGLLQSALLPAVRDLRTQMSQVQQLVGKAGER